LPEEYNIWHSFLNLNDRFIISKDKMCLGHLTFSGELKIFKADHFSKLHDFFYFPIEKISKQDFEYLQNVKNEYILPDSDKNWICFLIKLKNIQRRFDVEVEDVTQLFNTNEFDIEIEQ
jgi:hypothetical protein